MHVVHAVMRVARDSQKQQCLLHGVTGPSSVYDLRAMLEQLGRSRSHFCASRYVQTIQL